MYAKKLKLNKKRMGTTISWSVTTTFWWCQTMCNWIRKNLSHINKVFMNQEAKLVAFFFWPQGASENKSEVKNVTDIKVCGDFLIDARSFRKPIQSSKFGRVTGWREMQKLSYT